MTIFWLVAICLVIAALLFVVPPLLKESAAQGVDHTSLNIAVYKNQLVELEQEYANKAISDEQYQRTRHEIERRLLQDTSAAQSRAGATGGARGTAVAMLLAVPLVSVALYNHLGSPNAITGQGPVVSKASGGDHQDSGAQIESMVAQLSSRLEANPDDWEGWLMLARSYQFMQKADEASKTLAKMRARLMASLSQNPDDMQGNLLLATAYRMDKKHVEAAAAYKKVMPLVEANPGMVGEGFADLMTDYADTLALANNGVLDGEPLRLVHKALEVQPNHVRALWLSGTHAYEAGDFPAALDYWRRIAAVVPPDSEEAQIMAGNIQEIEAKMRAAGQSVPAVAQTASVAAPAADVNATLAGTVTLGAQLQGKVEPSDTVFVFARAASGPRMPLAIIKKQASEFPIAFTLDSSMSMAPGMSLATVSDVIVGARVSKSGNAMPQSGDLQGFSSVVKVGSEGLDIVIDEVVP